MDEASGNAIDAHGSNDLTDVNTVGAGTGVVNGCRDFVAASSEQFSIADNADFSAGDIDITYALWLNLKTTLSGGILSKYGGSPNKEYLMYYGGGTFNWLVSADGAAVSSVADGSPSVDTWYLIFLDHNSATNTIGIQINDGARQSADHVGGIADTDRSFRLGDDVVTIGPINALIDEVSFWKRVLTTEERDWLYNAGAGRTYEEIIG